MKGILVILLIVLLAWLVLVKAPEAKCADIAKSRNATYTFSAVRGCEIHAGDLTWLLTPNYLREYQREP